MHPHLEIGEVESKSWLACMEKALEKTADEETRRLLMVHFTRVANALKNKDPRTQPAEGDFSLMQKCFLTGFSIFQVPAKPGSTVKIEKPVRKHFCIKLK